MEKYGVKQTEKLSSKNASDAERCPLCDSKLEKHGAVLLCKLHGSKPFENNNDTE